MTKAAWSALVLALGFSHPLSAQTISSAWEGQAPENPKKWTTAQNWAPAIVPQQSEGGMLFDVTINSADITLNEGIEINQLDWNPIASPQSTIRGVGTLKVNGNTTVQNGRLEGGGGGLIADGGLDIVSGLTSIGWTVTGGPIRIGTGSGVGGITLGSGGYLDALNEINFLKDGGVTLSGTGTLPLFKNRGLFIKSGGTGTSSIGVPFEDTGTGEIIVQSGTLAFTHNVTLMGTQLTATNANTIRFSGGSTVMDGGTTFRLGGTSRVELSGGSHFFGGTITSSNLNPLTNSTVEVRTASGATVSGGTLQLSKDAPFAHRSGQLGLSSTVANEGYFSWYGGSINGKGVVNRATGANQFSILFGGAGKEIAGGGLTNQGVINMQDAITLDQTGLLVNEAGAIFDVTTSGQSFAPKTSASVGKILNEGTFKTSSNGTATVRVDYEDAGRTEVTGGFMNFRARTDLLGSLMRVDRTTNANALLLLGGDSTTSISELIATTFEFAANGEARFQSGLHSIQDAISGSGVGVLSHQSGTVQVKSNRTATLNFVNTAPFELNGAPHNTFLRAHGGLTNLGTFIWKQGTLNGSGELRNTGTMQVSLSGNATISDGTAGKLVNDGRLDVLSTVINSGVIFQSGGSLRNNQNGVIAFTSNGHLLPAGGSEDTLVINEGTIRKTGGTGSRIEVEYVQSGNGRLESSQGELSVNGPATITSGTLAASNAAVIAFKGSNTFIQQAVCDLDLGTVELAPPGTNVITLQNELSGTGAGAAILKSGKFHPEAGTTAILRFQSNSFFQAQGGLVSGAQGSWLNAGAFILTSSGAVEGPFINSGPSAVFRMWGGALSGPFYNGLARFEWEGGSISGVFTNLADGTGDKLMLIHGTEDKFLQAGANLYNRGLIQFTNRRVVFATNTALHVEAGARLEVLSGASSFHTAVDNENTLFPKLNNRGTLFFQPYNPTNSFHSFAAKVKLYDTNGILIAKGGQVEFTGGGSLDGTRLHAVNGGELDFYGPSFSILVDVKNTRHSLTNGRVSYDFSAISGTLTSEGEGLVSISSGTIRNGQPAEFRFIPTAPVMIDSMVIEDELRNFGELIWSSAAVQTAVIEISHGVSGDLKLVNQSGTNAFRIRGGRPHQLFGSGPGFIFTSILENTGRIIHEDSSTLEFDGKVQLDNHGSYTIATNGDLAMITGASALFNNRNEFAKEGPGDSTVNLPFDNSGTVHVHQGTLTFLTYPNQFNGTTLSGGNWIIESGARLRFNPVGTMIYNEGSITLKGTGQFDNLPTAGHTAGFQNDGALQLLDGASLVTGGEFENNGTINVSSNSTLTVEELDNDGLIKLNGTLNVTSLTSKQNGTFQGLGLVRGNVLNQSLAAPGLSPGVMTVEGNFTNDSTGVLEIEIFGSQPGAQYDQLVVTNIAHLGGKIRVFVNDTNTSGTNFIPAIRQQFTIVQSASIVTNGLVIETPDLPAHLRFQPTIVNPPGGGQILVLEAVSSGIPMRQQLSAQLAGGGLELSFPTENGFSYEIRRSTDLSLPLAQWEFVQTVPGDGDSALVALPTTNTRMFFVVIVAAP